LNLMSEVEVVGRSRQLRTGSSHCVAAVRRIVPGRSGQD
jgi:hypothetical protein